MIIPANIIHARNLPFQLAIAPLQGQRRVYRGAITPQALSKADEFFKVAGLDRRQPGFQPGLITGAHQQVEALHERLRLGNLGALGGEPLEKGCLRCGAVLWSAEEQGRRLPW